jgi:hypothetical protein
MRVGLVGALGLWFTLGCAATARQAPPPNNGQPEAAQAVASHTVQLYLYQGKELIRTVPGIVVGSELTTRGAQTFLVTSAHALIGEDLLAPRLTALVELEKEPIELSAETLALGHTTDMDLALVRVRGVRLPPAELSLDAEMEAVAVPASKVRFFLLVNGLHRLLTPVPYAPRADRY